MEKIRTLSFGLAVLVLMASSCDKEEYSGMNTMTVTSLRAEALPGAIQLRWDVPDTRDLLYVRVDWIDHASGELRTRLCSRYTTDLYVDGLLNRYGDYRFVFTSYGTDGSSSQPVHIDRSCEKAPSYYVETGENVIPLTASQIGTNAQEPSEGPASNLVDGNLDTFFQSFWDEWTYPDLKPAGSHYLTFDLQKEVTAFRFRYWNRKSGGSRPKTVNIYVGTDGTDWTLARELDNLPTDAGSSYESEVFLLDAPISHVKYEVVKGSDEYQAFFSLAEIEFTEVLRELVDPEQE